LENLSALQFSGGNYLWRAFARARNVENKPAAEPTSARMTVGFSGESVQPVWAWAGIATDKIAADHRSTWSNFFMDDSSQRNLVMQIAKVNPKLEHVCRHWSIHSGRPLAALYPTPATQSRNSLKIIGTSDKTSDRVVNHLELNCQGLVDTSNLKRIQTGCSSQPD
jgi:hypothetical protein